MAGDVARRLVTLLVVAIASAACSGGPTAPETHTAAACGHFATFWTEHGLRYGGAPASPPDEDPHRAPAVEAYNAAVAEARAGTARARKLAVVVDDQYNGRSGGDFLVSVKRFVALCHKRLPLIAPCGDDTVCAHQHLNRRR